MGFSEGEADDDDDDKWVAVKADDIFPDLI